MALQITKVNAPQSKLKIKSPYYMDPIGVTIHETGNIATAMSEVSYMLGNNSPTGYHFAVDDTRAVQGLPLNQNAFHSGDGSTGRGNRKTVAVEICYNWNGKTTTRNDSKYNPLYQKSIDNVVELTAQLFIQHPKWGAPKSGVNLFQHNDHKRKNCPQRLREEGKWTEFVERVNKRYQELKKAAGTNKESNPHHVQLSDVVILDEKRAKYWADRGANAKKSFSKNDFHKYWKIKSIDEKSGMANIYSTRDKDNGGWAVLHDLIPMNLDNPNNIVSIDTVYLNNRAKYWANKGAKAKQPFTAADLKKTWKIKSIQADSTANIYNVEDKTDGGWVVLHDLSIK